VRVAIDVDGVLAEFTLSFTTLATNMGLCEAPRFCKDQQTWEFEFDVDPVWNVWKGLWNKWMTLDPLIYPWDILKLNDAIRDHDVYFITTRPGTRGLTADRQTEYWLAGLGINTMMSRVIATKAGSKGRLMEALDIEIAIDDSPNYLNEIVLDTSSTQVVVREWPYNLEWRKEMTELQLPFKGVDSFSAFLSYL